MTAMCAWSTASETESKVLEQGRDVSDMMGHVVRRTVHICMGLC